jgi:nucleotide-binding universal stress UspA family protein
MSQPESPEFIVVGIDGSDAAIKAAKWAIAEATSRDIPPTADPCHPGTGRCTR